MERTLYPPPLILILTVILILTLTLNATLTPKRIGKGADSGCRKAPLELTRLQPLREPPSAPRMNLDVFTATN